MGLLINNYSTRNLFVWNNRFNSLTDNYANASGSTVTLLAGMLMGRVSATGKVKQCITTATDGSQIPIGILAANYEVATGTDVDITICIQGDVDYGMIVYGGSPVDTINSAVFLNDGSTQIGNIGDVLNGKGILPINTTEMTYQDNQ